MIQLYHPSSTPARVHNSWKPGAHCTTCRQPNRLPSVSSRMLSCPEPLLDHLTGLSFFLVAQSMPLLNGSACLRVALSPQHSLLLIHSWGTEGPRESGQFRGLLEVILSCLLPVLMSFPAGCKVSPLLRTSSFWLPGKHPVLEYLIVSPLFSTSYVLKNLSLKEWGF